MRHVPPPCRPPPVVRHLSSATCRPPPVVRRLSSAAFLLGALAAWYETAVLLGGVPAARMLLGMLLTSLYLCFATAVTALVAAVLRGVLATVAATLALLALAALRLDRREV